MRLLQPSSMVQVSKKNPDRLLRRVGRIVRTGFGQPSIFNTDAVVQELLRQGKSLEDARRGGCSGCVEAGAFGREAYFLSGYFNLPKILELTLHDGFDPRTGKQLGPHTGDPRGFETFDDFFAAFERQLRHFVDIKIRGNNLIETMFATIHAGAVPLAADRRLHRQRPRLPPGRRALQHDLHPGRRASAPSPTAWRRSGTTSIRHARCSWDEMLAALDADFAGHEPLHHRFPRGNAEIRQRRRPRR